jgi:hypothetical protein
MRKITEIYEEYKIFPGLQDHMFRVAAVASIICDSVDFKIDKEKLVTACLLHDMGNIVKVNVRAIPGFFKDEELAYWEGIKDEFVNKYGSNDHSAGEKILKELGIREEIVSLAENNQFNLWCKHKEGNDWYAKLLIYSDGRVNPHGVVSYEDRMEDARIRYQGRDGFEEENRQVLVQCGRDVEKEIFSHCKIKPEDITDEAVAPIISELRNFMVK